MSISEALITAEEFARLDSDGPLAELVIEVRSPDDRWPRLFRKIGEYLEAGVLAVCVLDPEMETAQVFRAEQPAASFSADETMELPDVLPGFRVSVKEFFA